MITLAAAILLLPGCSSLTPASTEHTSTPQADSTDPGIEASPTPTPTDGAVVPTDLSFDESSNVDVSTWRVEWVPLFPEDGFSILSSDDGNGSWAHTDDATGCQLFFYQGLLTDLNMAQDDRTITDDLLFILTSAAVDGVARRDIAEYAYDDVAPQWTQAGTVDMRTIWLTTDDGGSRFFTARVFGSRGGGLALSMSCPAGQEVEAEQAKLYEKYLGIYLETGEEP